MMIKGTDMSFFVVKTMECQSERRYRRTMKMSGGAPVLQHVLLFMNKRNTSI